jgi:hypothetical protein
MKLKAPGSFETSGNTNSVTQLYIPKDLIMKTAMESSDVTLCSLCEFNIIIIIMAGRIING